MGRRANADTSSPLESAWLRKPCITPHSHIHITRPLDASSSTFLLLHPSSDTLTFFTYFPIAFPSTASCTRTLQSFSIPSQLNSPLLKYRMDSLHKANQPPRNVLPAPGSKERSIWVQLLCISPHAEIPICTQAHGHAMPFSPPPTRSQLEILPLWRQMDLYKNSGQREHRGVSHLAGRELCKPLHNESVHRDTCREAFREPWQIPL